MALATIQTDLVEEGRRLREISPAQVASLAASIADVGLLNPITVFSRKVIRAGISVDGYGLVAGAHRLVAHRDLGLVEIDANIVSLSELERQIAECDENLCGSVLSKSERALFTIRRKEAYEALHPETKNGGDRRGPDRQVGELKEADRFTADTATKTGQSERAVQRDAERGAKISERALSMPWWSLNDGAAKRPGRGGGCRKQRHGGRACQRMQRRQTDLSTSGEVGKDPAASDDDRAERNGPIGPYTARCTDWIITIRSGV